MNSNFNFYELKATKRLPSPSGTAIEIIRLLKNEDTSVHQVARLIQSDPALSARVLNFANSAAFGARRPIANVQDAVAMIGMKAVRNFALSLSLVGANNQGPCRNFDYSSFWARSLLLAVSIAAVTARERTAIPEEAFSLGLLADIGRLALATAWPDRYNACLLEKDEQRLLKLENNQFFVDHDTLTLMLLADWGMPTIFMEALKLSHRDNVADQSRAARLAQQIVFARRLGRYCLADQQHRRELLPELLQLGMAHHFDRTGFDVLIDEVLAHWHEWGRIIQIDTSEEGWGHAESPESDIVLNVENVAVNVVDSGDVLLDILIVGDPKGWLNDISERLAVLGHSVEIDRDRESALKRIIERAPHLVVIDREYKPSWLGFGRRMDDLAFCKMLRECAFGKHIYLIMLTDSDNEDDLVEAYAAGVDDYMIRPVGMRVFGARIRAGQRVLSLQQNLRREHETLQKASSALALANRKLKHLANTDLLTGLPNRRYAMKRLEKEWVSTLRTRRPLSLLMIDLDYFKVINDTFGHDVGDEVLIHVSKLLEANIRAGDVACRLGGEEFTVIAPDTDSAAALMLAERIRAAVEMNQPEQHVMPRLLTTSIGIASSVDGKPDTRALLKFADKAMYKAKRAGRNNVKIGFA